MDGYWQSFTCKTTFAPNLIFPLASTHLTYLSPQPNGIKDACLQARTLLANQITPFIPTNFIHARDLRSAMSSICTNTAYLVVVDNMLQQEKLTSFSTLIFDTSIYISSMHDM